jgi:hypothetical protein
MMAKILSPEQKKTERTICSKFRFWRNRYNSMVFRTVCISCFCLALALLSQRRSVTAMTVEYYTPLAKRSGI